jgi:hypothetical protein
VKSSVELPQLDWQVRRVVSQAQALRSVIRDEGWIYISYSPCELPPNVRNSKCVTVVDPFTYRLSRCRESGNTDPCTSQSFHRA